MDVNAVLAPHERQALLLSVGTHLNKRSLSPVEVAYLFAKVVDSGGSLGDCARAARFKGTTMVVRFLHLLKLPESVRHLVDWGGVAGTIGMSIGAEIARMDDDAEEELLVRDALAHRLSGSEVRQVVQLRKRTGRSLGKCVSEVVGMRPRVERRYVYIGAVTDAEMRTSLEIMTQVARDALLTSAVRRCLATKDLAVTRLGRDRFTLVGGGVFGDALKHRKNSLEAEVNAALLGVMD